mgnify:CR=1 FL=1
MIQLSTKYSPVPVSAVKDFPYRAALQSGLRGGKSGNGISGGHPGVNRRAAALISGCTEIINQEFMGSHVTVSKPPVAFRQA